MLPAADRLPGRHMSYWPLFSSAQHWYSRQAVRSGFTAVRKEYGWHSASRRNTRWPTSFRYQRAMSGDMSHHRLPINIVPFTHCRDDIYTMACLFSRRAREL